MRFFLFLFAIGCGWQHAAASFQTRADGEELLPKRSLTSSLIWEAEAQATFSGNETPFWLQANRYGLSSVENVNGYLFIGVKRPVEADSLRKWRIGYGAEVAMFFHPSSLYDVSGIVQQLYADFDWKWLRLSVGSKERPSEMKNERLSSGSMCFGTNARPVPQVRFEIPDYVALSPWIALKGHFGYGLMTDGNWQGKYWTKGQHYGSNVLLHTKAGFIRLGNRRRFPIEVEGGLEMATQFGGVVHNATDEEGFDIDMKSGLGDFFKAIYSGGSDITDGEPYANAAGNTLGAWMLRVSGYIGEWKASVYGDHFFEDHSQLFLEYGWRDGLIGVEITPPVNSFIRSFVMEYMSTTDQSGSAYHDSTPEVNEQISGLDNYYNHSLYSGWQHWGQAIGSPLFVSPVYAKVGVSAFRNNRFKLWHFGLEGRPTDEIAWRTLFTTWKSWGTYHLPSREVLKSATWMVEGIYTPNSRSRWAGWQLSAAFGHNGGSLLHTANGFQLTLRRTW